METRYVKCLSNAFTGYTKGKIYLVKNGCVISDNGKFQGCVFPGFGFYLSSEEEYNFQEGIIKKNNITNEQKLQELKQQMAALEEAIKKESEIKVGDYLVITKKPTAWNSRDDGEYPLNLSFPVTIKVEKLGGGNNGDEVMYDGRYGWDLSTIKRNNIWRRASKEETEKYEASKKECIYTLSSGYKVRITKDGIYDMDTKLYKVSDGKKLTKLMSGENLSGRNIVLIDATYKIGCQTVTLKELQEIIKIAEELQK
jgi:hypothetical protein